MKNWHVTFLNSMHFNMDAFLHHQLAKIWFTAVETYRYKVTWFIILKYKKALFMVLK